MNPSVMFLLEELVVDEEFAVYDNKPEHVFDEEAFFYEGPVFDDEPVFDGEPVFDEGPVYDEQLFHGSARAAAAPSPMNMEHRDISLDELNTCLTKCLSGVIDVSGCVTSMEVPVFDLEPFHDDFDDGPVFDEEPDQGGTLFDEESVVGGDDNDVYQSTADVRRIMDILVEQDVIPAPPCRFSSPLPRTATPAIMHSDIEVNASANCSMKCFSNGVDIMTSVVVHAVVEEVIVPESAQQKGGGSRPTAAPDPLLLFNDMKQLRLRFQFFASAMSFNIMPEEKQVNESFLPNRLRNFWQCLQLRYGLSRSFRKIESNQVEALRFALVGSEIINKFWEEDIVSDREAKEVPGPDRKLWSKVAPLHYAAVIKLSNKALRLCLADAYLMDKEYEMYILFKQWDPGLAESAEFRFRSDLQWDPGSFASALVRGFAMVCLMQRKCGGCPGRNTHSISVYLQFAASMSAIVQVASIVVAQSEYMCLDNLQCVDSLFSMVEVASNQTNSFSANMSHLLDAQLSFLVTSFSESSLGCIVFKVYHAAAMWCINGVMFIWTISLIGQISLCGFLLVLLQVLGSSDCGVQMLNGILDTKWLYYSEGVLQGMVFVIHLNFDAALLYTPQNMLEHWYLCSIHLRNVLLVDGTPCEAAMIIVADIIISLCHIPTSVLSQEIQRSEVEEVHYLVSVDEMGDRAQQEYQPLTEILSFEGILAVFFVQAIDTDEVVGSASLFACYAVVLQRKLYALHWSLLSALLCTLGSHFQEVAGKWCLILSETTLLMAHKRSGLSPLPKFLCVQMANSALVVGSSQIFNGTWDIQGELLQTWYLMVEYKMRLNIVCWLGQSRFWKKNL